MSELGDKPLAYGSALVFFIGHVFHRAVQTFVSSIKDRCMVFKVNFIAVIGIWLGLLRRFPGTNPSKRNPNRHGQ